MTCVSVTTTKHLLREGNGTRELKAANDPTQIRRQVGGWSVATAEIKCKRTRIKRREQHRYMREPAAK